MSGPDSLRERVGRLRTRMGAFFPGSHVVFRGHDLHAELKDMDFLRLYVFGVTGRSFSPPQLDLMRALWTYTSYPDARIWNNRVAALAGSVRSTGSLGMAAALAVSEAHIYGRGSEIQALRFFIAARRALDAGDTLDACLHREMETHGRIAGYGRPLINADERIAPIMAHAESLGLADGPHITLAFAVERHLLDSGRNLRMNYGAVVSAFGADLGLSPREFYLFMFPSLLAGMPPCFIDAADAPEGGLFPVPCDGVNYEGPPQRPWIR